MNQQEFETRIGTEVIADTFEYANRIYMAAGDMDKDKFCREWKNNAPLRTSTTVSALTLEVEHLNGALANANKCYERAEQGLRDFTSQMADFLIIQAEKWSARDLREKAIKLVGERDYLRRKMEMKFDLWEDDRKLVLRLISEK